MWEMYRQVGSSSNYRFVEDNIVRIKFRYSAFKDDEFKIEFISAISEDSFTKIIYVQSGNLEDVKNAAIAIYKKFRKKEKSYLNKVNSAKEDYNKFFNVLKESEKNESKN